MKKIIFAAVIMITMVACGGNKAEAGSDARGGVNNEIVEKKVGSVVNLTDDSAYRPGVKPTVPTIIDFNAVWCGPCKVFKPVFHEAATKFPNVKFVSADVDNLPQTAQAFRIQGVPTVVFIGTDGRMTQYVGTQDLLPAEKFDALVNAFIGK